MNPWCLGLRVCQPRERQGGFGLAGVLVVMVILAVVAFSMAAITTFHGQRAQRSINSRAATYLAEGAIAQAMHNLKASATYGTRGETLVYGSGDQQAVITFNASNTLTLPGGSGPLPWSTSNQAGSTGTGWSGTQVAPGSVHLVATATSGGQRRTVEALVGVPRFPFAVCSSGALNALGSFQVRGATSASVFLADPNGSGANQPASVAGETGVSVTGTGLCYVSGDVIARSTQSIQLPPYAYVGGRMLSSEVRLPAIDITTNDPVTLFASSMVQTTSVLGSGSTTTPYTLSTSGHYTPSGGLLHVTCPLLLQQAILYVDGNLQIDGYVAGTGVIVCTGNITVSGATSFAAVSPTDAAALLCRGNVSLSGSLSTTSYFQGMVYAGGNFAASNLTVGGVFLSGASTLGVTTATGTGSTTLTNVRAIYLPEMANATLSVSGGQQPLFQIAPMNSTRFKSWGPCYWNIGLDVPYFIYDTSSQDISNQTRLAFANSINSQMHARYPWFTEGVPGQDTTSFSVPQGKRLFLPTSVGFEFDFNQRRWRYSLDLYREVGKGTYWWASRIPINYWNPWSGPTSSDWLYMADLLWYQSTPPSFPAFLYWSDCSIVDQSGHYKGPTPVTDPLSVYNASLMHLTPWTPDQFLAQNGHSWDELCQATIYYMNLLQSTMQSSPHFVPGGFTTVTINLGDSRFYGVDQPIRVLSWSEHD